MAVTNLYACCRSGSCSVNENYQTTDGWHLLHLALIIAELPALEVTIFDRLRRFLCTAIFTNTGNLFWIICEMRARICLNCIYRFAIAEARFGIF